MAPIHPKVKAGTAAAAVSGLLVWLLGRYVLHGHVDPIIAAEIYAAVPAVLTFAAGWATPSKKKPPPVAAALLGDDPVPNFAPNQPVGTTPPDTPS